MRATQVLTDCPACRVEAAFVELVDPSERVPVPLEGRCRLCGHATELGDVVAFGQPFVAPEEVVEALARWAAEDGEPDMAAFVAANFGGLDPVAVAARVVAGERVETSFDVIAWLFPQAGAAASASPPAQSSTPLPAQAGGGEKRARESSPRESSPPSPRETSPPSPPRGRGAGGEGGSDPRDVARALASVMVADGRVRPGERRFLDRALGQLGAPPLEEADLRVWRPNELGPVADPAALLRAMRLLALVDREADGSEIRVLREYARAWHLDLPEESLARPGAMAQLGRALVGLFWR